MSRAALFLLAAIPLAAGTRPLTLRGKAQELYYLPASGAPRGAVLYLPGDGGWHGFAIDMAQAIASWGYDVYALDTKHYLMSFTGERTLTVDDIRSDMVEAARQVKGHDVLFVGWSQGAAMAALTGAAPAAAEVFAGLVCIGLPDHAVLGWRTIDNLTYLTKKDPDEPMFQTEPSLAGLHEMKLAVIESRNDEYTPLHTVQRILARVRGPKKLAVVEARNHKFDGNRDGFFRSLKEGLEWAASAAR